MAGEEMEGAIKKRVLPDEMVVEILSRLPLKKTVQFKTVCKSWRSLLSDPKFSLSTSGRERAIVRASLDTSKKHGSFFEEEWMNFYSLDHEFSVLKLPKPRGQVPTHYNHFKFFGTCNGLIVFSADQRMYLWNPSTRNCRELSQLNRLVNRFLARGVGIASGLCFDASSDDYKVVLVTTLPAQGYYLKNWDKTVFVASLRDKTEWTDISFPYKVFRSYSGISGSTSGVLVSGHLHWIVKEEIGDALLIIYFDERMNQFNELPMPEEPNSDDGLYASYFGLTVLHGCLCMSRVFGKSRSDPDCPGDNDVFVMREYGVRVSWTKLFTIQGLLVPLNVIDSNDLVLVLKHSGIYTFNLRNNSLKFLTFMPSNPPLAHMEKSYNLRNKPSEKARVEPFALRVDSGPLMYAETLEPVNWLEQA